MSYPRASATIFVACVLASIGQRSAWTADSPAKPLTNCYNSYKVCVPCCCGGEAPAVISTPTDQPCLPGQCSNLTSWIDNYRLELHHDAVDYAVEDPAAAGMGCATCGSPRGAASAVQHVLPSIGLHRIHRYRETIHRSSFGPGVFCEWDAYLSIDPANISVFDPNASGNTGWYEISPSNGDEAVDGVYWDEFHAEGRDLRLFDGSGRPTADRLTAATAVLRRLDGTTASFEFVDLDPGNPAAPRPGRMTRWTDRNGNAIAVAYQFARDATDAQLSFDREKLWLRSTITDAYARVMSFTYARMGGRWVVTGVSLPNGGDLSYRYSGSDLVSVRFPDGAESTFTTVEDDVHQTTNRIIVEAGAIGIHRRKTAYFSHGAWIDPQTGAVTAQVTGLIRRVDNGAGEMVYSSEEDPADPEATFLYEGGNKLLRHVNRGGPDHEKSDEVVVGFVPGAPIPATRELTAAYLNDPAKGRLVPTSWTDALGRVTSYTFDLRTGARLGTVYPDGSSETITRNAFNQPLRRVDRLGRITDQAYDAMGNLLAKTVATGTPAQAVWRWAYNDRGQVVRAQDADFDPAHPTLHVTDYAYDERGFLTGIIDAGDADGGARPIRTFAYDQAGRMIRSTDAAGRAAVYAYDVRNRVVDISYADGSHETFAYATAGPDVNLLSRRTDRNGNITAMSYDGAGRMIGETSRGPAAAAPILGRRSWSYLTGTDLVAVQVDNGDAVTTGYDYRNRVGFRSVRPTAATILTTAFLYDAAQRLVARIDPYNRRCLYAYDINDRQRREVCELIPGGVPSGRDLLSLPRISTANPPYVIHGSSYDAEGQLGIRSDGRGQVTAYAYDGQGRMTAMTEASGLAVTATTRYAFDPQGNRTSWTSPRGVVTAMAYTGRNLLRDTTEGAGTAVAATSSAAYSPTGKIARRTDFRGNATAFAYEDCCDRLVSITDASGAVSRMEYDPYGNVIRRIDPNGLLMVMDYDARHRPVSMTNGAGETTTYGYDDDLSDRVGLDAAYGVQMSGVGLMAGIGSAVLITDALGQTMLEIRDGLMRSVRHMDGNGHLIDTRYDAVVGGLVETAAVDALGHVSRSRADGLGRVRTLVDAAEASTALGYDANGNAISRRDPNLVGWDKVFDARDREMAITDTAGSTYSTLYDLDNDVVAQIDGLGHALRFTYDARDRRSSATDRIGGVTRYAYDADGDLASVVDAQGSVTSYGYDSRRLLLTETFPAGQAGVPDARSYAYDPGRRLVTRTDQAGIVSRYGYDGANRLVLRGYPDGLDDHYAYDRASRLLAATSDRYHTRVSRSYDPGGRLVGEMQVVGGATYALSYAYDDADRQIGVTYPDGMRVVRTFTVRDQLASAAFDGSLVATRTYDAGMRPTMTSYGNGLVETRSYRADDLVSSIRVPGMTDFTYIYDAAKRQAFEGHQLPADIQSFGYDDEGRVTTWSRDGQESQNWSLSLLGDWNATTRTGIAPLSQTRWHSPVHEITRILPGGGTAIAAAYDPDGNLLTLMDRPGSASWDVENRLQAVVVAGVAATYAYDALGRRLQKTVGGVSTVFVHDRARVIADYEGGALAREYVYGSYVDEVLAYRRIEGRAVNRFYPHYNAHYSVAALSDDLGQGVERFAYDAYGRQTRATLLAGAATGFERGFTGYLSDPETGLLHARARMYSPALGRFVGRDPLGYFDGYSAYRAYHVPNGLDPSGQAYVQSVPIPDGYTDAGTTDGPDTDPIYEGDESAAEYRDLSEIKRESTWKVTAKLTIGSKIRISGAFGEASIDSSLEFEVGHGDTVTSTDTLQEKMYQVAAFRKKYQLAVKCCTCALDCLRGPPDGWINDTGAGSCPTFWKKGIKKADDYMKGAGIGSSWKAISSEDRFKLKNAGISGTSVFVQNEFLNLHRSAVRSALGSD